MEEFILHLAPLPKDQKCERVHALLVTRDGRMLVRYKNGEARNTGGHIDPEDASMEAALRRELKEEINCEIDKCDYVGYIEYRNLEDYHDEIMARMVARVSKIGAPKPDPDRAEKWIYGRTLLPLDQARAELIKSMPFGNTDQLFDAAIKIAQEKNYFDRPIRTQVEALNPEVHEEA